MSDKRGKYPRIARPATCRNCGRSYNPRTTGGRYCSPACRQAAYRRRKRTN